jgi:hypothetical protein
VTAAALSCRLPMQSTRRAPGPQENVWSDTAALAAGTLTSSKRAARSCCASTGMRFSCSDSNWVACRSFVAPGGCLLLLAVPLPAELLLLLQLNLQGPLLIRGARSLPLVASIAADATFLKEFTARVTQACRACSSCSCSRALGTPVMCSSMSTKASSLLR